MTNPAPAPIRTSPVRPEHPHKRAAARVRRSCGCAQPRPPGVLRPDPARPALVVATCRSCGGSE